MDEILNKLKEMSKKLDTLDSMDKKLEHSLQTVEILKMENKQLQQRVNDQEERINFLEQEMMKKYIVIHGINEEKEENVTDLLTKVDNVIQSLGMNINGQTDIQEAKRLGKPENGKKRPVHIEMSSNKLRKQILQEKKKLKTIQDNIWIEEAFPKKIMEQRKELKKRMKEKREKGNLAYIRYNKIIINKKAYTSREINDTLMQGENYKKTPQQTKVLSRTFSQRSPDEEEDKEREKIRVVTKTNRK